MTEVKNLHRDLIQQCAEGDRKAQFELYKSYSKAMFNICYRITNNYNDAEDALQEAFLKAFTHINTFEGKSSFGAWLKRIVVNASLNQVKKKNIQFYSIEDMTFNLSEDGKEQDESNIYLNIERVKKAIQKLPDGYRIIFSLYLLEGYDHKEIAEILHITESTSKSQYNRAKRKLKDLLKEEVYYE